MEEIQHFLHKEHPLKLIEIRGDDESLVINCNGCGKKLEGQLYYACELCGFFLDKACANLPQEIQHFFHPNHPLLLQFSEDFRCGACDRRRTKLFSYRCGGGCDFNMDVACTQFQPISPDDEDIRILHFSHHHPLQLFGRALHKRCRACDNEIPGQAYCCESCWFYLDESCANNMAQAIQHRCHSCPLLLRSPSYFTCDFCGRKQHTMSCDLLSYSCSKCDFRVHVPCAQQHQLLPIDSSQAETEEGTVVEHWCHHHPLQLANNRGKGCCQICKLCNDEVPRLNYICRRCDIYIHKSCLEVLPPLPRPNPNPSSSFFVLRMSVDLKYRCSRCFVSLSGLRFTMRLRSLCVGCVFSVIIPRWKSWSSSLNIQHPIHPCSLTLKYLASFKCNACFSRCFPYAYCCRRHCDFYLGIECANSCGQEYEHIQHLCHRHPLEYSLDSEGLEPSCVVCEKLDLQAFYSCRECDFHIHKSCLDVLPQQIDHYFNHTFVLLRDPSNICEACNKPSSSGVTFRSIEGSFEICVQCLLRPKPQFDGNGIIRSIHHWHPLAVIEKSYIDHAICFLCGGFCAGPVYSCKMCDTFFHKSCAELPSEIQHLCHPAHSLRLISGSALDSTRQSCSFCFRDFLPFPRYGGVYHCKECNFQLDMACATSVPSIEYQVHPHFLTVVERTQGKEICQACYKPCEGFDVLFCAECKFSLHIKCGPLPRNIKHTSHVHKLLLQDYYDEDNVTDEFPCHDCESKRDPRERVYVCAEGCQMIIEFKCAAFEVIQALRGKRGDVELRSEYPYIACKLISRDARRKEAKAESTFNYKKMMKSVRGYVSDIFKITRERYELEDSIETNERRAEDEFILSCDAWFRFSARLRSPLPTEKLTELFERHHGSAKASNGSYNLPQILVPFYENAVKEHGIFIKDFALRGKVQNVCVFYLCAVLYDMRIVKVVDITEGKLRQWLTILNALQEAGINTEYATKLCWGIAKSCFVIQAKARLDEISYNLDEEVEQLSKSVEEIEAQLQAVKNKTKVVVKQLKDQEAKSVAGMREFRKDYKEALLIKWKPTSEALYEIMRALQH